MKKLCLAVFLFFVLLVVGSNVSASPGNSEEPVSPGIAGDAHEGRVSQDVTSDEETREKADPAESLKTSETEKSEDAGFSDETESEYVPEEEEQQAETIYDPLEPFNRAMYHFNDKLYFWLLKPVGQVYGKAVPEPARISVRNFFDNLVFPVRFLSCLLQADFSGAVRETSRFAVNTIWGIGGLMDASSTQELNIPKQDVDLGQTLGIYGAGHGFYVVWPFFGPSSLRDSADIAGGFFLYPVYYLNPWYTPIAVRSYEVVNETSLRIGDYESLKQVAIDPYVSIRDAFVQYRSKKINTRKTGLEQLRSTDVPPQQ